MLFACSCSVVSKTALKPPQPRARSQSFAIAFQENGGKRKATQSLTAGGEFQIIPVMEKTTLPPDVEAIQKFAGSELNEVNDRLKSYGWVLLGILITRRLDEGGSFCDEETYILGYPRNRHD